MNFLKQTALVLGLVSLSLGGWSLFRNWRQKLAIHYSVLCFVVSGWALSFVSYATLGGRLSKDIHWIFNLWMAPVGVSLVSKVLSQPDRWGKTLLGVSLVGAVLLSLGIGFSIPWLTDQSWFWALVSFWPSFIFLEYIHVMILDLVYRRPVDIDFISAPRRRWLYAGLGTSLLICSFDHIPGIDLFIPSIGNLLLTVYLVFLSLVMSPQKILNLEAIVSRFFATVILSLVITGYFALLYQYMSETFGLFLLNSFLISFSILVLWNPLVTFFRFIGRKLFETKKGWIQAQLDRFRLELGGVTSELELRHLLESFFWNFVKSRDVQIEKRQNLDLLPASVQNFLVQKRSEKELPILYRSLIQMEMDQLLGQEKKEVLGSVLAYMDHHQCDLVFPVGDLHTLDAVVRVSLPTTLDEWSVSGSIYSQIFDALQGVGPALNRIQQVRSTLEKDRLALLGEMSAGLAHEIRNPLGAIKGASELFQTKPDPQWAKVIQEEVERLNRLVSQFLDYAHTSRDVPEMARLDELVQKSVAAIVPMVPERISLEVVYDSGMTPIQIIPDQVQQVLTNLIQNAIKAVQSTPDPRIVIQVQARGFSVSDNGVGMTEETRERIFQPFFSMFNQGSGLGLSICQRLVASNDGSIQVRSKLGEGTTFVVRLCETL